MPTKRARLSPEDWIMAGFRALTEQGAKALNAEGLARALGTTKGSFYWHFKDVPDFHQQMLNLWEHRVTGSINEGLASEPDPVRRLYMLGDSATANDALQCSNGVESAIRAWAQDHDGAAQAVGRMDAQRLATLTAILAEIDLTNPDFARIIYGASVGMGTLSATDSADNRPAMSTLLAALLALRDA